jgi:hypothetical protein
MAALTELSKKTDIGVVTKTVEQRVENDAKTVRQVVTNPVGTITGIPKGIGHLFNGYKAEAGEYADEAKNTTAGGHGGSEVVHSAKADAARYADRKVQATVNLGMHFAGVPGVPYLGDVQRAMNAIYNEDPAVLRARQRKILSGYGLSSAEVARFENTLLLSPTRQRRPRESWRD